MLLLAVAALLVFVPSAQGAFHLMKVSEVFPGTNANINTAFIELQMFAAGQNQVAGHKVDYYTATGTLLGSYTIATSVPNGDSGRKILIGDTQAAGTPDFTVDQLGDALHPGTTNGGAVCFPDAAPPDCVSWGAFTPAAGFPNTQSANAPVIPDGSSLTRSIAPGCPNLLEDSDDTNNSANDFAVTTPSPENNSVAPPTACGQNDTKAPDTEIKKAPSGTIKKDKAKIKFKADESDVSFECKLDKGDFEECTSPVTFKNLKDGKHKVLIRAADGAGNIDSSPAKAKFKVKT